MTTLGERLDGLSPEKRALLERQLLDRRAAQSKKGGSERTLRRRGPDDPLLLSYSQQQLWFLQEWQKDGSAYNASLNLRFTGQLDEDALRRSFQAIIDRHETLRTIVVEDGGVPHARLLDDPVFAFHEIDLRSDRPPTDEEIATAVREVVHQPFDLAHDVMLRGGLIRLGTDDRVICMTLHHIACDGWSRGILFDELTALYIGFVTGSPAELPPLPVQYGDFAQWQLQWLQGDVLKGEIDFWRQELSGADFVLDLPTDHPRPPVLTFIGGRLGFDIPVPVADALRRVGREERATHLHGHPRGHRCVAPRTDGSGGLPGRKSGRQPALAGDGAPHRILRQHPAAPPSHERRPDVPRVGPTLPRDRSELLRPPGHPLRADRPGAAAQTPARPQPTVPGQSAHAGSGTAAPRATGIDLVSSQRGTGLVTL